MKANKHWMSYFFLFVFLFGRMGWSEEWSSNEQLSFPPGSFLEGMMPPDIGVDKKGNAFAVWTSEEQLGSVIKASRYDCESHQWNFPKKISTERASSPRLAVASDGKAIVVWKKELDGKEQLFFNVYLNEWGTEKAIDLSDTFNQDNPSVGVDDSDHAIVVWQANTNLSEDALASVIRSATYQFSTSSFSSAVNISTNYSFSGDCYLGHPKIAVNDAGKAIVVWKYDDGASTAIPFRIQSNTYQSGSWGKEEDIMTSPTAQLIAPQVVINSKGDVLAVWLQTGLNYYIVTAAKKINEHWGSMTALSDLGYLKHPFAVKLYPPLVYPAFDSKGIGYVIWNYIDESSDNDRSRIQVKTCQGDEWSKTTTLIDSGAIPGSIKIAADDFGNTLAIFATEEFSEEAQRADRIHISRFIQGMNVWCVPELLANENHNYLPNIATNPSGSFHAVWAANIHDFGIIQSAKWHADQPPPPPPPILLPPSPPQSLPMPPRNVRAWQLRNDFAIHSDRINFITWEAPANGATPVSYRVYRDADLQELVAEISAQGRLRCEDPLRKRGKEYTYFLVTIDADGRKSQPYKIVVKPGRR